MTVMIGGMAARGWGGEEHCDPRYVSMKATVLLMPPIRCAIGGGDGRLRRWCGGEGGAGPSGAGPWLRNGSGCCR